MTENIKSDDLDNKIISEYKKYFEYDSQQTSHSVDKIKDLLTNTDIKFIQQKDVTYINELYPPFKYYYDHYIKTLNNYRLNIINLDEKKIKYFYFCQLNCILLKIIYNICKNMISKMKLNDKSEITLSDTNMGDITLLTFIENLANTKNKNEGIFKKMKILKNMLEYLLKKNISIEDNRLLKLLDTVSNKNYFNDFKQQLKNEKGYFFSDEINSFLIDTNITIYKSFDIVNNINIPELIYNVYEKSFVNFINFLNKKKKIFFFPTSKGKFDSEYIKESNLLAIESIKNTYEQDTNLKNSIIGFIYKELFIIMDEHIDKYDSIHEKFALDLNSSISKHYNDITNYENYISVIKKKISSEFGPVIKDLKAFICINKKKIKKNGKLSFNKIGDTISKFKEKYVEFVLKLDELYSLIVDYTGNFIDIFEQNIVKFVNFFSEYLKNIDGDIIKFKDPMDFDDIPEEVNKRKLNLVVGSVIKIINNVDCDDSGFDKLDNMNITTGVNADTILTNFINQYDNIFRNTDKTLENVIKSLNLERQFNRYFKKILKKKKRRRKKR